MSLRRALLLPATLGLVAGLAAASPAHATNLIVNGGFEASSDNFTTPTGWTNIGATNGVLRYAQVPMLPVYEGANFYTIGGVATNGFSALGWGITQTVATTIGNTYRLTFGYSGENGPGLETVLGVNVGGNVSPFTITATGGDFFTRPFTTATIDYIATSAFTPISFTLLSSNEAGCCGNNDPLLDGISFEQIAEAVPPGVPEPATWLTMILGFAAIGTGLRRRRHTSFRFA